MEQNVTFSVDHHAVSTYRRLTLEDDRIRSLVSDVPRFTDGQPIPVIGVPGLPNGVRGFWALWRVEAKSEDWCKQRIFPLFKGDDGRVLVPTAAFIWDQLVGDDFEARGQLSQRESEEACAAMREAADIYGKAIYDEIAGTHSRFIGQEREKMDRAFGARRNMIDRLGLPEVREYRRKQIDLEQREWLARFEKQKRIFPDLTVLLIARIEG